MGVDAWWSPYTAVFMQCMLHSATAAADDDDEHEKQTIGVGSAPRHVPPCNPQPMLPYPYLQQNDEQPPWRVLVLHQEVRVVLPWVLQGVGRKHACLLKMLVVACHAATHLCCMGSNIHITYSSPIASRCSSKIHHTNGRGCCILMLDGCRCLYILHRPDCVARA